MRDSTARGVETRPQSDRSDAAADLSGRLALTIARAEQPCLHASESALVCEGKRRGRRRRGDKPGRPWRFCAFLALTALFFVVC